MVEQDIRLQQNSGGITPAFLAAYSDTKEMSNGVENSKVDDSHKDSLSRYIAKQREPSYDYLMQCYEDYNPAEFSWRDLYHKLCLELMLQNFDNLLDFKLFYDFINGIGESI